MATTMRATIAAMSAAAVLQGCGGGGGTGPTDSSAPAPAAAVAATAVSLDCIPSSPACTPLQVAGDPDYRLPGGQNSPFTGTADPSMRQDPATGALYLAYSWPHYAFVPDRVAAVETHMARSTDGGATWAFVANLWPTDTAASPVPPGTAGVINHEVPNILPVRDAGGTTWYAARLDYFLPVGGAPDLKSFRIRVFKAASPDALSVASSVALGSAGASSAWPVDHDLSQLAPELAGVSAWNEPALYAENGTLYLLLVSQHFSGAVPAVALDKVHVFSTVPAGDPASWSWTYRGVLAGAAEAGELGAQRLTQVDIARGADGRLLLVATPDDLNTSANDYDHKGCVALEVASLATPTLARAADGKLVVRARVSASDANSLGSAACTYEAASATGLLFTRRNKTATEFTIGVWRTGLRF